MVKARVKKLFTGRGKTRPIPRVVDASDARAARVVAAQQTPRSNPAKAALGPRPGGQQAVLGTKVANGGPRAGTYSPIGNGDNI